MTKEITKAYILQQLEDKFQLRELIPERFSLSETVIPTYDIRPHLGKWTVEFKEKSITSGPAAHAFYIVPGDEIWTLSNYNVVFMATGAYTVTGVYVGRAPSFTTEFVYLDMTAGQTASYAVNLPQPVILHPNDRLYLYVDSYTSTADLRLYVNTLREKIR